MWYFMHLSDTVISYSQRIIIVIRFCVITVSLIVLLISMQRYWERKRKKERCNISNKGKEKMRIIPGSIYLPRKHFPTKQKYQQETAERERQSRGQFKAHKRTIDCLKRKKCNDPLPSTNIRLKTTYTDVCIQGWKRNIACRCGEKGANKLVTKWKMRRCWWHSDRFQTEKSTGQRYI